VVEDTDGLVVVLSGGNDVVEGAAVVDADATVVEVVVGADVEEGATVVDDAWVVVDGAVVVLGGCVVVACVVEEGGAVVVGAEVVLGADVVEEALLVVVLQCDTRSTLVCCVSEKPSGQTACTVNVIVPVEPPGTLVVADSVPFAATVEF
jgi:hypothetical protein